MPTPKLKTKPIATEEVDLSDLTPAVAGKAASASPNSSLEEVSLDDLSPSSPLNDSVQRLSGAPSGAMKAAPTLTQRIINTPYEAGRGLLRSGAGLIQGAGELVGVDPGLKEFSRISPNDSFAEKAGHFTGEVAQVAVPEAKIAGVLKVAKIGSPILRTAAKVATSGITSGAVEGVKSGGDTKRMKQAAIGGAAGAGAAMGVGSGAKAAAPLLYKTPGLKLPNRLNTPGKTKEVIQQGIDEGISNTPGGLKKLQGLKAKGAQEIAAAHGNQPVDWNIIRGATDEMKAKARAAVRPDIADMIDSRLGEIEEFFGAKPAVPATPAGPPIASNIVGPNGQPIMRPGAPASPGSPAIPPTMTATQGLEIKRALQDLSSAAYGKDGVSAAQLDKKIAAGIRQAIEATNPKIAALNRQQQNRILLEKMIEADMKATGMNPITAVVINGITGPGGTVAYASWKSPWLRSMLGRGASNIGSGLITGSGTMGAVGATANSPDQARGLPPPPTQ